MSSPNRKREIPGCSPGQLKRTGQIGFSGAQRGFAARWHEVGRKGIPCAVFQRSEDAEAFALAPEAFALLRRWLDGSMAIDNVNELEHETHALLARLDGGKSDDE